MESFKAKSGATLPLLGAFESAGFSSSAFAPAAFAVSIDLDDRVRVHVPDPPLSVGAAGVNQGIPPIVDDPEPRLVDHSCWSRLVDDNNLSPKFD